MPAWGTSSTFVSSPVASIASIGVAAAVISKLRTQLDKALRLATQAWRFEQLGTQLIGPPDTVPGR